jgi:DNA-binding winged helix-turn-helix (wHTH) protein
VTGPVTFGEFVLDAAHRELRRRGRPVRVSPLALRLLGLLLEHHERIVSKEELRAGLWPGDSVSESSLARVASELRAALGDRRGEARFVRTVHGVGYTFACEITDRARVTCRLVMGDRRIPLGEGEHDIGRAEEAAVIIDSPLVSRRHAKVTVTAGRVLVEDLHSKNGTFVGGRRISAPTELRQGDEIGIGPMRLRLEGKGPDHVTTQTDVARSPVRRRP